MAVPTTWTELKAEIADWISRDDLTNQIPNFIGYAEARLTRDLRVPEMETVLTQSTSAASITLPTDFIELRAAFTNSNPKVVLSELAPARLREIHDTTQTAEPRHFAIQAGTTLLFGPAPDTSYSITIIYWAKLSALGASTASNWLLTSHPDLYLAAALAEAHLLMQDEARASIWDSRTVAKIAELNEAGRRKAKSHAARLLFTDLPNGCNSFDITRGY